MSPRGRTPGLKRGRHGQPYWIAKQVVRNTLGFPDKCISLPWDADAATLARLCCEHTARLQNWIAEQSKPQNDGKLPEPLTHYDGTMLAASRVYQEHPYSPFRKVKHNTRKTYTDCLKLIETTVGARLILPAQLIRMSTLPNAATVSSRSVCNVARSATSEVRLMAVYNKPITNMTTNNAIVSGLVL